MYLTALHIPISSSTSTVDLAPRRLERLMLISKEITDMGKLYIRVLVMAMIVAMVCVITATAQTEASLPPKIVPADSTISHHHMKASAKHQHHRKASRHHRKHHSNH